eukprot:3172117-Prymnesium_polylepis.1
MPQDQKLDTSEGCESNSPQFSTLASLSVQSRGTLEKVVDRDGDMMASELSGSKVRSGDRGN